MPGYAFKSEAFTDNPDDVALVKGENVHQGFIDWQAAKRWPSNESDVLAKYKLVEGDVVLAMDRPWVTAGLKWAYIRKGNPDSLLVQRVARLRAKKGIDQTFLRCLVSSPYFSGYIQPIVTGVNVPHISAKQIGDCLVNCPPLETQRKIAGILSAYDDLMENNRRRIAILERMAEELYREWFVRMRFPGYQNTKFVKGVPEGWEMKKLPELVNITYGFPFKADLFNNDGIGMPIVRIRNIIDSSTADYTTERVDERYIIEAGDFLIGMDGEFHMNHWCGAKALLVQRTCRVKAKSELLSTYISLALRAPIKHLEATVVGATVAHLGAKHLNVIDVVVPPKSMESHLHLLNKLRDEKVALARSVRKLGTTRNALLARLILGKLNVSTLDPRLPKSMPLGSSEVHEELAHA